jgi:hypothetical protein
MSRYAKQTSVPVARSEQQVKQLLMQYGADDVTTGTSSRLRQACVQFVYRGLPLRMSLTLPDSTAERFRKTTHGRARDNEAATQLWERECRQQWRVLFLLIHATLEAVENGVISANAAFLPWLMLPSGGTLADELVPRIDRVLATGDLKALPFFGEDKR